MKFYRMEGSIAIKTKDKLERELDRLLDTDKHNIVDKNRWMLNMDLSDRAVLSAEHTVNAIRHI